MKVSNITFRVQYHLSESYKLYIGLTTIKHLLYYILLSIQFKFINDFNVRLGKYRSKNEQLIYFNNLHICGNSPNMCHPLINH